MTHNKNSSESLDRFISDLSRAREKLSRGGDQECKRTSKVVEKGTEQRSSEEKAKIIKFIQVKAKEDELTLYREALKSDVHGSSVDKIQTSSLPYLIHKVEQGDTIQGIVLRYGCTLREIMRLNGMTNDRLNSFTVLRIPKVSKSNVDGTNKRPHSEASKATKRIRQARLLLALKHAFPDLDEKEAKFYLMDSNWCVPNALQSYREDVNWEKSYMKKLEENKSHSRKNETAVAAQEMEENGTSLFERMRKWWNRLFASSAIVKDEAMLKSLEIPLMKPENVEELSKS